MSKQDVIAWLRSAEGEAWSRARTHQIDRHRPDSGVFAELILDGAVGGCPAQARWPEPFAWDGLGPPLVRDRDILYVVTGAAAGPGRITG